MTVLGIVCLAAVVLIPVGFVIYLAILAKGFEH